MIDEKNTVNAIVTGVYPDRVHIEVLDIDTFRVAGEKLSVGAYLRISDSEDCAIIAVVQSFSIQKSMEDEERRYVIDGIPIGFIDAEGKFSRGGNKIAIPPVGVAPASRAIIQKIYAWVEPVKSFEFSSLAQDSAIRVPVDGDRFFNKHIAIVGSTGCGKSCSVATILRKATESKQGKYNGLNNSHIIIFDLHGEYSNAFPMANKLSISNLLLPYWLMNGEELEELLIESGENQAYNQSSLLRRIITRNKQKHSKDQKVMFDSPVKFSLNEVLNCILNLSRETREYKNQDSYALITGHKEFPSDEARFDHYFANEFQFEEPKNQNFSRGAYNDGTLDKFISRIRWKLSDERLKFLLGHEAEGLGFEDTIRQILGYQEKDQANVTIIDLSGIPFEVLSISVSLVSRILFDYGYYYKRTFKDNSPRTPLLLVYEEAHKYVPNLAGARYTASRLAIERIAKEGRKYGVTLALITQRPSEISETIFSQCNNFIALRLTNPADQNYVKRLLPDALGPLIEALPTLESGEAIIIGDAVVMPSLVQIDRSNPEPSSTDIKYLQEWKREWYEVDFKKVIGNWVK
ncbi:MAG TPA: ATP-binding protein [Candidatus Saccharimonadales bacterium]|jgi:DNA helicase HerA-like ATPase|nr:ATP-binding protein [Candidatus Saccharimonadales bacterium]